MVLFIFPSGQKIRTCASGNCIPTYLLVLFWAIIGVSSGFSQSVITKPEPGLSGGSLFDSDSILDLNIRGPVKELMRDRSDNMQLHPMVLSYQNEQGVQVNLPVQMKTRGHFRRLKGNCIYPPLLIQFSQSDTLKNSIFSEQYKTKLVMPCRGDQWVIREWVVYKMYNLLGQRSFRTRLVRVKLEPENVQKEIAPFFGILLEEEDQLAKRNNLVIVERKIDPIQAHAGDFLSMAVFQYMIGNTDWSVQYLQNIKLLAADSLGVPYTVPYDFDHAGFVDAPYAKPAEQLHISSVRERVYRGYCVNDLSLFEPVIKQFLELRPKFYELINNCPDPDPKFIKKTTAFMDEFYKTLEDPKRWQKDFSYPCDPEGTGNVIIRGLKE